MTPTEQKAVALLKRFFGYDSFRPLQLDIINDTMAGHDMLVLMPTGGGKSICYQIPALLSEGLTIVISPLIALMKDQVEGLLANGIPAAAIHSNQSDADNRTILDMAYSGRIKLLYISPERLTLEMERWAADMKIARIAIDEAHCISQWGHDFRPEYTQLAALRQRFPEATVMALTATADRTTREDIVRQLDLRDPRIYISSFDRPNISLKVVAGAKKPEKIATIAHLTRKYPGDSGIVYCMSRKSTETMARWLTDKGLNVEFYHAGMTPAERNNVQQRFINGDVPIVCATVAFGMGIDKSNIRWVVHNNLPQSIESYYQEIGRAGRDGLPAEAILFYSVGDLITLQRFVADSGRMQLNTEKLKRMRQFAETTVCRRRVLLSYFNEVAEHDCGNCDICVDPPQRFDATKFAQMALSAVVRTEGKAGFSTIIDILRGSRRPDILEKGYDRLKTFGVGRNGSNREWDHYLTQMIQLGLIDIHYDDHGRFCVTDYGRRVLFEGETVMLTPCNVRSAGPAAKGARLRKPDVAVDSQSLLLAALKEVRAAWAKSLGVPAELVFNDRTLHEIAIHQPINQTQFSDIQGVGQVKSQKYWRSFVNAVRHHKGLGEVPDERRELQLTAEALHETATPAEAAARLGVSVAELNRNISHLIDADIFNEFSLVISREEFTAIMNLNRTLSEMEFRAEVARRYSPGLDEVALSMASYMLRHR